MTNCRISVGDTISVGSWLSRHRISAAMFDQLCAGAAATDTMELLEKSQHSPDVVGPHVEPDVAWRLLAAAERRDPEVVADILLYPSVGVWLTRALHFTRRGQAGNTPWVELGYLQLIVAAAAIRCAIPCVVRVPVWHGVVTLPTVGQLRLPTVFPIGMAEVRCSAEAVRLVAHDGRVSIDIRPDVPTSTWMKRGTYSRCGSPSTRRSCPRVHARSCRSPETWASPARRRPPHSVGSPCRRRIPPSILPRRWSMSCNTRR